MQAAKTTVYACSPVQIWYIRIYTHLQTNSSSKSCHLFHHRTEVGQPRNLLNESFIQKRTPEEGRLSVLFQLKSLKLRTDPDYEVTFVRFRHARKSLN